jgi:uncharacterized membrane protein YeaQ/YmgE (transglycosylase-associated protein family)
MINFILWLVVGAIVGWVASSIMGTRHRLLLNIVEGSVGAFLAGFLLTLYLGISTINFSLPALLVSLLGALILLTALSFFSRRPQEETTGDFDEEVIPPEVAQPIAEIQTTPALPIQPEPAAGNFCRQCGTANPTDAQFCNNCGVNLGLRPDLATA